MNSSFDERYTAYQANRSGLRRAVRKLYLRRAASQLVGPTLDFGCGVGELLERLPPGSKGLEYNQASVTHCRSKGLDVDWYDGFADDWGLRCVSVTDGFQSIVISHVLEHLDRPMAILSKLLHSAQKLGVGRVLVIVPGRAGYRSDPTHRTFVDRAMLQDPGVVAGTGFKASSSRYFPGNIRRFGDWLPHHELQVLYLHPSDTVVSVQ